MRRKFFTLLFLIVFLMAGFSSREVLAGSTVKSSKTSSVSRSSVNVRTPKIKNGIPILMYHEIGDGPNSLYVSENDFKKQMYYLRDNGYRVLNVKQAVELMQKKESTKKTVAISFDDGYISFYTRAYPVLKECKFSATVFVITGLLSIPNYLTWEQARLLAQDGIEIGSHTQTHPSLPLQDDTKLTEEILGSRQVLEQNLGRPVETFCYPCGNYDSRSVAAVQAAGYLTATTTVYNRASLQDNQYLLPRVRVRRGISIDTFAKML